MSKKWFILACVIHHLHYWLALSVLPENVSALRVVVESLSQHPQITWHFLSMWGIGGIMKDEICLGK